MHNSPSLLLASFAPQWVRTVGALISLVALSSAATAASGFSEPSLILYGKVHHVGEGSSYQLTEGSLIITFQNAEDSENRVELAVHLGKVGQDDAFSYAVPVPMKYLPARDERSEFLSTGSDDTRFQFAGITVNGIPAVAADGEESIKTSFSRRASQVRLDLNVSLPQKDSDSDKIPDWWEELYGFNPHWPRDAVLDTDNDGENNLAEFLKGTNPLEPDNTLEMVVRDFDIPERGRIGFLVDFDSAPANTSTLSLKLVSLSSGFTLSKNGSPLGAGGSFSLEDMQKGLLMLAHTDPAVGTGSINLEYGPSPPISQSLEFHVVTPSEDDVTNPSLWLDAYELVGSKSSELSIWQDRSESGNAPWQGADADKPKFLPDDGGHPAVSFDGKTQHFHVPEQAFPLGDMSVFALFDAPAGADPQHLLATNRLAWRINGNTGPDPGGQTIDRGTTEIVGRQPVGGNQVLTAAVFTDDVSEAFTHHRYDGKLKLSNPDSAVQAALGLKRSAPSGGMQEAFSGKLREMIVFPDALSTSRKQRIVDYLESKWLGAVIWDWSKETRPVNIQSGGERDIIRGGLGADDLNGGADDDVVEGGPGDDLLEGGPGKDTFVYRKRDKGRDTIDDFTPADDVLELSAMFSGYGGDPRDSLSMRVETIRDGNSVVSQSVLTVDVPGTPATRQEIVLAGVALNDTDLTELLDLGVILTGAPLSKLPRVTIDPVDTYAQRNGQIPATMRLRRTGDVSEAMSVNLSFQGDAVFGRDYEAVSPVVTFSPGDAVATIQITPTDTPRGKSAAQSVIVALKGGAGGYQFVEGTSATVSLVDAILGEPMTYASWKVDHFPAGTTEEHMKPAYDKDGDQVANSLEYVIGTDANDSSIPQGGFAPEIYLQGGLLHLRFVTVPNIIDVDYHLLSLDGGAPKRITDQFDLLQNPIGGDGKIHRTFRSKVPANVMAPSTIIVLEIVFQNP